ncbi:BZ3500_MvSof-1268-A1-R1_Chr4-3g07256 [Microbotryum saponariae]|uniref:BZ3500_MvSof-1268-A1-R1_Chr4-3g07256 protein n=1 Tax=Microbotryum saponariae TaxID=289078 RepID=A0A2X0LFD4_9BASI|nr:BZ3500_MvSof-1268-A1-R1_Chr4-3g07256 [Microbotryum saponariae]SDA06919.1 BZ3501_MvSof-1269-A2-R1_Chr4-2g06965 [Microbotryum saponariae]
MLRFEPSDSSSGKTWRDIIELPSQGHHCIANLDTGDVLQPRTTRSPFSSNLR